MFCHLFRALCCLAADHALKITFQMKVPNSMQSAFRTNRFLLIFETVEEALENFVGDAVYEPGSGPQESLESIKEKYGEETILRAIGFYDEIDELLDNRMEELSNVMDTYNKESQNLRKKRDAGSFGEFGEYDSACDALAERYDSIYAMVEAKYKRLEKEHKEKYGDVMELCRKHGLVIQVFFKEMFSDSGQHRQEYGN